MPSKPTFRLNIPSSTQENLSPAPPTTITFALPGSAAEDLLQRAPAPKPLTAYNIIKSKLSTWNLNTPLANAGLEYDEGITSSSFASDFLSDAMALDPDEMEWEGEIASNALDGDVWMATTPPGPFPL